MIESGVKQSFHSANDIVLMAHIKRSDVPAYYDSITRYYLRDADGYYLEFDDISDLQTFCHHNPEYTTYSYRRSIPNASKTIKEGLDSWGFSTGNKRIPSSWRVTCYKCGCKGHYANECLAQRGYGWR